MLVALVTLEPRPAGNCPTVVALTDGATWFCATSAEVLAVSEVKSELI